MNNLSGNNWSRGQHKPRVHIQCREIIIKGNAVVSKQFTFSIVLNRIRSIISSKETDILQFTQNGFNVNVCV